MGGFTDTVGVTAYQSVLKFSVSEMDGITLYQSVLTAVGSFRFLRWVASLRQLASLPIKVSVAETDSLTVYQSVLTAGRHFSVYPSFLTAYWQFSVPKMDGLTVCQSVLTAGYAVFGSLDAWLTLKLLESSFQFLRWMSSLST